jgi:hypothetical protein
VKFKHFFEKAKLLDNLIDEYRDSRKIRFVPISILSSLVTNVFPNATLLGYGLHKIVFRLQHKTHMLVLKVGKAQDIELDHQAYNRLPHEIKHVYLAKIYWHTKYSILQQYGLETELTEQELARIRLVAAKYGLLDITCENIRIVDGNSKIVDAGIAPLGLFKLWHTADSIKNKLPASIRKILRKFLRLVTAIGK